MILPCWVVGPFIFMGFGAVQLPGPGVFGPPKDRDLALAVLRRAVDAGVNHIDTAQEALEALRWKAS